MENTSLQQVKEILPWGAVTQIAKKANVQPIRVTHFLQGKIRDHKVLLAVSEYIVEMKEKEKPLYEAFKSYCEASV